MNLISKSPNNYFFWVRFHPNTSIRKAKETKRVLLNYGNKYDILISNSVPLYTLLRKIDIHITELSTVVIEAKEFGVPSIIMHKSG